MELQNVYALLIKLSITTTVLMIPPHKDISPTAQVQYVGRSISIECKFEQQEWKKDWFPLPEGVQQTSTGITIQKVEPKHDGLYACVDGKTRQIATSMLRVGLLNGTNVLPKLLKKTIGSEAIFRCINELQDVQWYFRRKKLPPGVKLQAETTVIRISVSLEVGGEYYCIGFDPEAYENVLSEGILVPIDQSKIEPKSWFYKKNEDASFECSADESESVKWYFNNGRLPANARPVLKKEHILQIHRMKEGNTGLYECIAYTKVRNQKVMFSATGILVKQEGRFFKKDEIAFLNEKVKLSCNKEKVNKWRWYFYEESLLPEDMIFDQPYEVFSKTTLEISHAQLNNSGQYECLGFQDNKLIYSGLYNLIVLANCPTPMLKSGSVITERSGVGMIAHFTCSPDLVLVGSEISQCLSNGTWSTSTPSCKSEYSADVCPKLSYYMYFSILVVNTFVFQKLIYCTFY